MLFGAPDLLSMPVPDENGAMVTTQVYPKHENLFTAARYISGPLLMAGLAALCVSFFQRFTTGRKFGLAAAQITFGVVIIASGIVISGWGYPTQFIIPTAEGSNVLKSVNVMPGPPMTVVISLTVLSILLGIGILGVGIAQTVEARRQ